MQVSTPSSRFPGMLMTLVTITLYTVIGIWLVGSFPEFTNLLESIRSSITLLASSPNPLH